MEISKDLQHILEVSFTEAKVRAHEFITLEHLLYAMTFEKKTKDILKSCGVNLKELQDDLYNFIEDNFPRLDHVKKVPEPKYTLGFKSLLEIAASQAESSEQPIISSENLLVAMFKQPESHAVYFLNKQNIGSYEVVSKLSHTKSTKEESNSDISAYCTNLNEEVKKGCIDPIIGRKKELDRCIQIVLRRRKNNPILVGEAGVGKTAIAEGLAYNIVNNLVPKQLSKAVVYSLNMANLLSGTKYRGEFEERLKTIVEFFKEKKESILLIDEIHTIIGAGSIAQGSADASNLLKPYLAKGDIRCIGTTTFKEYRRLFEKEEALSRRFQRIDVHEPSIKESKKIVMGLKSKYEYYHSVLYTDEAIDSILDISNSHIKNKCFPDKAIDLMDDLGSIIKIKEKKKQPIISKLMVESYSSKFLSLSNISESKETSILSLEKDLKNDIYGQGEAIQKVVDYMMIAKAKLNDPNRPLGAFLFAGPTGVGKTELAKTLATQLDVPFCRFDMSEYIEKHAVSRLVGAPPGYVGHETGGQLTEIINAKPNCVLLLDEIEKAHIDIYNVLLQIMDYATLTDNNGKKADFRNVIIIMTSNIGYDGFKGQLGFSDNMSSYKKKSIEKKFTPEFRNRLTDTIWFNSLTKEDAQRIVEKELHTILKRVKKNNEINLSWSKALTAYLTEEGFSEEYGARPIKRIIEKTILKPLSLYIVKNLNTVSVIQLEYVNDSIVFKNDSDIAYAL
jgi:ATP-dependent Clp protease ATP-binding subunit ClpA